MRAGPNGPMPGLKPVGEARDLWRQLYPARAGQLVELSRDDATSPQASVSAGPDAVKPERAEWAALDVLRRAGDRPGHVFNLGHGVIPKTDPDVLTRLAELVHGYGRAA